MLGLIREERLAEDLCGSVQRSQLWAFCRFRALGRGGSAPAPVAVRKPAQQIHPAEQREIDQDGVVGEHQNGHGASQAQRSCQVVRVDLGNLRRVHLTRSTNATKRTSNIF